MRNGYYAFLFLIILSGNVKSQGFSPYYFVLWSNQRKLTWNDFKGNPPAYSNHEQAGISSQIYIHDSLHLNDTIIISIINAFDKFASWTKIKDTLQGKYVLLHEQGHFDITEIYARKIRKALSLLKNMQTYNPADSIVKIYSDSCSLEEDRYDEETKHSINMDEQGRWIFNIQDRLKELEPYSKGTYIIRIH